LRDFIEGHRAQLPGTFPIEFTFNLRTTRPGVLDVNKIDTLNPGKQVYPNYVIIPQEQRAYGRVLGLLGDHFGVQGGTEAQIEAVSTNGVQISADAALALVTPIKTRSRNTWRDTSIATIIRKVSEAFGGQIMLRFRTSERRVGDEGFISTGTLSGDELRSGRAANIPTLWIMAARTTAASAGGAGQRFMYPTLVIPSRYPSLFMFNRGS